jgi:hypothetical protein
MEAVVDAYGSSERAMGWYYYLDGKMKVPFPARCRFARPISVLKVEEAVEVLGMAPEQECESEMFVWVGRAGGQVAVPLAQLQPLSKDARDPGGSRRLALLGGSRVRAMSTAKPAGTRPRLPDSSSRLTAAQCEKGRIITGRPINVPGGAPRCERIRFCSLTMIAPAEIRYFVLCCSHEQPRRP